MSKLWLCVVVLVMMSCGAYKTELGAGYAAWESESESESRVRRPRAVVAATSATAEELAYVKARQSEADASLAEIFTLLDSVKTGCGMFDTNLDESGHPLVIQDQAKTGSYTRSIKDHSAGGSSGGGGGFSVFHELSLFSASVGSAARGKSSKVISYEFKDFKGTGESILVNGKPVSISGTLVGSNWDKAKGQLVVNGKLSIAGYEPATGCSGTACQVQLQFMGFNIDNGRDNAQCGTIESAVRSWDSSTLNMVSYFFAGTRAAGLDYGTVVGNKDFKVAHYIKSGESVRADAATNAALLRLVAPKPTAA